MKDNRKIKEIENSELWIQRRVREFIDNQGRRMIEFRWELADKEIDLGSLKKPNKNILGFKYEFPQDRPKPLFGTFFGGE